MVHTRQFVYTPKIFKKHTTSGFKFYCGICGEAVKIGDAVVTKCRRTPNIKSRYKNGKLALGRTIFHLDCLEKTYH